MVPTIRIDDNVYSWLQSQAKAFEDTPNSVLRRVAGLEIPAKASEALAAKPPIQRNRGAIISRTHQSAFRKPLLAVLLESGGEIHRKEALLKLEIQMSDQLTDDDKSLINSGTVRWEKSAEWELRKLREEGVLMTVQETPRGVWALTDIGFKAAEEAMLKAEGERE
jgi:hypothetical protein